MNKKIKSKIKLRNKLYKIYIKNGRNEIDFSNLENSISELNMLVSTLKAFYYARLGEKLNDPIIQAESYWSILKTFYSNKKFC